MDQMILKLENELSLKLKPNLAGIINQTLNHYPNMLP